LYSCFFPEFEHEPVPLKFGKLATTYRRIYTDIFYSVDLTLCEPTASCAGEHGGALETPLAPADSSGFTVHAISRSTCELTTSNGSKVFHLLIRQLAVVMFADCWIASGAVLVTKSNYNLN